MAGQAAFDLIFMQQGSKGKAQEASEEGKGPKCSLMWNPTVDEVETQVETPPADFMGTLGDAEKATVGAWQALLKDTESPEQRGLDAENKNMAMVRYPLVEPKSWQGWFSDTSPRASLKRSHQLSIEDEKAKGEEPKDDPVDPGAEGEKPPEDKSDKRYKQQKVTFAQRKQPKSQENLWMWTASRDAFNAKIKSVIKTPAKFEAPFFNHCCASWRDSPGMREVITEKEYCESALSLADEWLEQNSSLLL